MGEGEGFTVLMQEIWRRHSRKTRFGDMPKQMDTHEERCFRAVDSMSDGSPKLIASDEQPNYQGVHAFRLGKADRPAYQPFDPGPQIDVLAFDLLRMCCADR